MAVDSSKKLTKFKSRETLVTADFANSLFGGLFGSSEGDALSSLDPRVVGHVHDGEHADGHASKIDLVQHVKSRLRNTNLADDAVTKRNIKGFEDKADAIPLSEVISGTTYYYLNLDEIDDTGAFSTTANVTSNSPGDLTLDDFVFGSAQLNDSGLTVHDSRMFFDKSKGAFRAGTVNGTEWDALSRGSDSVAFGKNNTASGVQSVIGGGQANTASGLNSVISGGITNTASGIESFVGGGDTNAASNTNAAVAGGLSNTASNIESFVGGGASNTASERASVVAGGNNNTASGIESFIGGGDTNLASNTNAGVASGISNTASNLEAFVGGGASNTASGRASGILAGTSGVASGLDSFIGSGAGNAVSSSYGAAVAGQSNTVNAGASRGFIGAGNANVVTGVNAVVVGGDTNQAISSHSGILGGEDNRITAGSHSFIVGGGGTASGNIITTSADGRCFIGGGKQNTITNGDGDYSLIVGGEDNDITSNVAASGETAKHSSVLNGRLCSIVEANYGTILGGLSNQILTGAGSQFTQMSTILNGEKNEISSRARWSTCQGLYGWSYMQTQKTLSGGEFSDEDPDIRGQAQTSVVVLRGTVSSADTDTVMYINNDSSETLFINQNRVVIGRATWVTRRDVAGGGTGDSKCGERIVVISRGTGVPTINSDTDHIAAIGSNAGTWTPSFALGASNGKINFRLRAGGGALLPVNATVRVEWTEVWDDSVA